MFIVHCLIDNKWKYLKCYKKDNEYYSYAFNEHIHKKLIHWIENDN